MSSGPPAVTLVVGPEELLTDRAVGGIISAVRALDAQADVRQLDAGALDPGLLNELTSPSLFGERKVIVIRGVAQAADALVTELRTYLQAPADDVALVLVHKGGAKGKGLLDAARKAGAVEVTCAEVRTRRDKLRFVQTEFRAARRRASEDAVEALLDSVGGDLRSLASAAAQLVADTSGLIDVEVVRRYYEGIADVSGFSVADRAVAGRAADALTQLRWALAAGTEPVLVVSALASTLRSLVRLAAAPRGLRPADLARELGMPPWKIESLNRQLRGWTPDGVASALIAVAAADAQVKGAGGDPLYALERAVVAVAQARTPA